MHTTQVHFGADLGFDLCNMRRHVDGVKDGAEILEEVGMADAFRRGHLMVCFQGENSFRLVRLLNVVVIVIFLAILSTSI